MKVQERALSQLAKLARLYPEPERHLVRMHNCYVWLDIFEEYLKYEENRRIRGLVQDFRRAFIGKMESEVNYAQRVDVLIELIARKYNDGSFQRRKPYHPYNRWGDPKVKEAMVEKVKPLHDEINKGRRDYGN